MVRFFEEWNPFFRTRFLSLPRDQLASRGETHNCLRPIPLEERSGTRSGRDEAPRLKKYFLINGISAISFWLTLYAVEISPDIVIQTIFKFSMYLAILLWLNSAYYLSRSALGVAVETWEFQKEQVKLTLWTVGIFIIMEIPIWLIVLSG